ncbi:tellurite resistance TerB C-terminal domain-containing protein [uncultured Anaerococcus sp.]|uniref:tellurite resistance TerB C-terminal domain-containing protein n=1 Tax=uncultured Anaerococcus sp. TaxID=293428 RepID=UPI00288A8798|nr:tellurite resistance TerB C-terminal domain-containing protein [uncultured Anaerococcus sp.]
MVVNLQIFMEYQLVYLDNLKDSKIEEIYLAYLKENPKKSADIAAFIGSLSLDRQVEVLKSFETRDNYGEILGNLLKNDFTPIRVLGLVYLFKNKLAKAKDKKALFEIIREENFEEFLSLIKDRDFDIDLLSDIFDLKKVKAKRIKLNKKLVKKSRKDLSKTVATINDFVGEEDYGLEKDEEKNLSDDSENLIEDDKTLGSKPESFDGEEKISQMTRNFLGKILDEGFISKDEATDLALEEGLFLNVFINNMNDELYEFTNDQTLVIEGDRVLIDEFYVDMIKELIDG